ncbi:ADP-glyceromanno-heptose 6-epimerase [uncultured Prochlorococcus sp.]|uniref:ADP-glyceromanno-heptose 6-epimerase n=1 Tax=uncultured Prochlorococcus sp. TaxID=159733 RepID=UPI0025882C44|nr:ADP-glyceromanno-heptose 6-epimerase [uncultured Prochlorococcus sp.]
MIIITGGAGFIGSNLVRHLWEDEDIVVVDNFENGKKLLNIGNIPIVDLIDKKQFLKELNKTRFKDCDYLIHLGAASATTEWNGKYLIENNYKYSKILLEWCIERNINFIYASSASVYGLGKNGFCVEKNIEDPINAYAYSKFLFDEYVKRIIRNNNKIQISGLRFFNVYGPYEEHKKEMSSPIHKFYKQLIDSKKIKLFKSYGGFESGNHKRDFISVFDCIEVIKWIISNKSVSGIFNCGTGKAATFKEVAEIIIEIIGYGEIEYIDFPEKLKNAYQSFTCADMDPLKNLGLNHKFSNINYGIKKIFDICDSNLKYK